MKCSAVICLLAMALSCSVNQKIQVALDASGTADLRVVLDPSFYEYLRELGEEASEMGVAESVEIFDTDRIVTSLSELPGVTVGKIATPAANELEVELSFQHIGKVLEEEQAGSRVITFVEEGKTKIFKFYLDTENYSQIKPLLPVGENPVLDALGPQPDDPVTEEEYLEILEFALGDEGPQIVLDSYIEIRFKPEGQIMSQSGGEIAGEEVVFRIPLLDFLLLHEPIEYSLSYR